MQLNQLICALSLFLKKLIPQNFASEMNPYFIMTTSLIENVKKLGSVQYKTTWSNLTTE